MNRTKNWAPAVLTLIATAVYMAGDAIAWAYAAPMMLAGAAGGFVMRIQAGPPAAGAPKIMNRA